MSRVIVGQSLPCLTLRPHGLQYTWLPCSSPSPRAGSNSCPLNKWCYQNISPSVAPSPPAFNLAQHRGLYQWFGSLHQVAKELALQLPYQSFQWVLRVDFLYNWLVWAPCCPRDSQEFTPAPQFKSINSLCSAFIMVQLSHLYMSTGKTIALTVGIFVSRMVSLLFITLSRYVMCVPP